MHVAAQLSSWGRRWPANPPGPLQAGSPPGGVPFLTDVLADPGARIMVEAAFGADVKGNPNLWNFYDITTDVRQADGQRVVISPVGRSDETSQSQPAGCNFQLDNTTGAYTGNHPGARWWPNVKRNTPIRVRLYVNGLVSLEFQGYANGWVPSWDTSGNLAVVTVSASGILRRLNQGKTPLKSPLYRSITANSPVGYWPLEDGSSATQAGSATQTGSALAPTGSVSFGTIATLGGAAATVQIPQNAQLSGSMATYVDTGFVAVHLWVKLYVENTLTTHIQLLRTTNDGGYFEFDLKAINIGGTPGFLFTLNSTDGLGFTLDSGLGTPGGGSDPFDGNWHDVLVRVTAVGSDTTCAIYVDGVLRDTKSRAGFTAGQVRSVTLMNELIAGVAGTATDASLALFTGPSVLNSVTNFYNAGRGYVGETATARLARLCAEEGVPIEIAGICDTAMGPQSVATLVALLRECETADDGLLYDGLGPGLGYVTRQFRYNRAASLSPDMAADPPQVGDPFAPADDDQRNRNLVKADRKNGSSATFEDTDGPLGTGEIQDYDSSVTVNVQTDDVLPYRAAWEVHKGTVEGFRYPRLSLDLAATPALVAAWLATPLAGRVDVLNAVSKATQHPPGTVSQLLEGYAVSLSPFDWEVAANCSPFAPWRVAVLEGSIAEYVWRLDSGASTITVDYPAGTTSIQVAVADGYLWSTAAGDYPRDLDVGGIQVTATAASGASSPQTFTVTSTTYPLLARSTVKLWRPPVLAL